MKTRLAVVIPAYKATFLREVLESLACQSDPRFRLYVGDDASPEALSSIVPQYGGRIDLVYHRFEGNLGSVSLTRQWSRCVELSSEPWVWLFSDDDTADPDCVKRFYDLLDSAGRRHDVYRFNTVRIDSQTKVMRVNPPHPSVESATEFLYHVLMDHRKSYAPEHIFRREAYDRCGGFVEFPLAWCSDHASWAEFGRQAGIRCIEGPLVRWRASSLNITTAVDEATCGLKVEATMRFLVWLHAFLEGAAAQSLGGRVPNECMQDARSVWALRQWRGFGQSCDRSLLLGHLGRYAGASGLPETTLRTALDDCLWVGRAQRYPYLAAFPRVATERWPRAASLLNALIRALRGVAHRAT